MCKSRSKSLESTLETEVDFYNQNGNHSLLVIKNVKSKVNKAPRIKSAVKAVNKTMESDDSNQNRSISKIQFEEGDELIEMETDDGDRAKEEFKSDDEEEGEISSENETSDEEMDLTEPETEETENEDASATGTNCTEDLNDLVTSNATTPESTPKKGKKKGVRRQSVKDKLDTLTNSVKVMQELLLQQGIFREKRESQQPSKGKTKGSRGGKHDKSTNKITEDGNESETTIYQNILEKVDDQIRVDPEIIFNRSKLRNSSSSDEPDKQIDTSDEMMEVDINEKFIADCAEEARKQQQQRGTKRPIDGRDDQPCTSKQVNRIDHAEDKIREAEASKAQMFRTPGKDNFYERYYDVVDLDQEASPPFPQHYSLMVDENYLVIGAHLDGAIQNKIINNEYVDFSRLITKDRLTKEDDHCMELISKGGQTFFVPVSDHEATGISSFHKWEQAYRIFSNVYTRRYLHKASELIQYNHIIYSASLSFVWENVYSYDKEFRMHISNFP